MRVDSSVQYFDHPSGPQEFVYHPNCTMAQDLTREIRAVDISAGAPFVIYGEFLSV